VLTGGCDRRQIGSVNAHGPDIVVIAQDEGLLTTAVCSAIGLVLAIRIFVLLLLIVAGVLASADFLLATIGAASRRPEHYYGHRR